MFAYHSNNIKAKQISPVPYISETRLPVNTVQNLNVFGTDVPFWYQIDIFDRVVTLRW